AMNSEQKCTACGNPARLRCPTCLKNSIPGSYFCTQECFKKNWTTHKLGHKKDGIDRSPVGTTYIPKYNYTGSLRAVYPLSPRRPVPPHIIRPDYGDDPTGQPKSEQSVRNSTTIKVLNEEEIESMRTVCKLAREVLDITAAAIKPGITTDELDRIVHEATIERDSYPSPSRLLTFFGGSLTEFSSVNEVICHGIPDQRELQDGDIVNVDVTLYHNGFHGDLNEIYPVGNIDEDSKRLLRTAKECLDKAIEN
ncbi:4317_t:CDS:2, partial [Paraglomus brasilianum]